MTKTVERDIAAEVSTFTANGYKNDGTYNFACGVMESVLVQALRDLPKTKRDILLDRLAYLDATYFRKNG